MTLQVSWKCKPKFLDNFLEVSSSNFFTAKRKVVIHVFMDGIMSQ